ncbi:MAG: penicillin-binding protein 1C, partial [Treponema sp.]|nr:penicillin-binding protein 1C [Treponema sp.]
MMLINEIIRARKVRLFKLIVAITLFLSCLNFFPLSLLIEDYPHSFALYDNKGNLIGASVASDGQWRFEECEVPDKFIKALIEFEDKRFYYHLGVDLISLCRAFISDIKAKRIVSGGSTITMQVIRLMSHQAKRSLLQKIKEALFAVILECRLGKYEILKIYASNAPFGGNVVGLEAASWRYYNRPPETLTWAEAATLAVLPNQPSLVHPGANRDILLTKRNALLERLHDKAYINDTDFELALAEKLPDKPYSLPMYAPHYMEKMKADNPSSAKVFSTINLSMQRNVQYILETWSNSFAKQGINNAAALVIDTKTGDILAYCANTGFGENVRNKTTYAIDMIQSRRSSGSLLKPFLYAAMLDKGLLLRNQLVIDLPTRIGNYKPDNNIPEYSGVTPASTALSRSLNIPAIRELRLFGVNAFLAYLKKCGFTTFDRSSEEYGLPLILGGGEITLYEATKAYAGMMNKASYEKTDFPASVGASYITLDVLQSGIRPDEEALWQSYATAKRIAWKTLTSNGNRDAWAIGTTKEYTVGIWIGNAEGNGNPRLKSITTAAPVLFDVFSYLPLTHWIDIPVMDLEYVKVCSHSGFLAGPDCPDTEEMLIKPKGVQLAKVCPYCQAVSFTPDGKYQANISDLKGPYEGTLPLIKKMF